VSVLCCQVEVSATGWSLVQRSPTEYGASECDREAWTLRRLWPTRSCRAIGKSISSSEYIASKSGTGNEEWIDGHVEGCDRGRILDTFSWVGISSVRVQWTLGYGAEVCYSICWDVRLYRCEIVSVLVAQVERSLRRCWAQWSVLRVAACWVTLRNVKFCLFILHQTRTSPTVFRFGSITLTVRVARIKVMQNVQKVLLGSHAGEVTLGV
jgi:hypothetical protein